MNQLKKKFCDECNDYCETEIKEKDSIIKFKDESISINEKYLICKICASEVYDEDCANDTLKKLSIKYYEKKHGMGLYDFKKIRNNYGLSQILFSKVLNWGSSTLKRYESGVSLPDSSHISIYKILRNNPPTIVNFYQENKDNLTIMEQEEVEKNLKGYLIYDNKENKVFDLLRTIYSSKEQTIFNGNTIFNPSKLLNMITFFSNNYVLKTKLMKLLWYADFLMFKKQGKSISGISYMRLPYGPVPKSHDLILGTMQSINAITITEEESSNGYTRIIIEAQQDIDQSIFERTEIETMNYVYNYFRDFGSVQITEFSHKEKAWLETPENEDISYSFADALRI